MDFDKEGNLIKDKCFYSLTDACKLKGLCRKTAYNNKLLLPNKGIPDGHLGGKQVWSYESIAAWLSQTDEMLK